MNDFNFNGFWNGIFDDLFESTLYPMTYTYIGNDYPQTNDVVKATVESPLAFNLITDSDKEVTLELAMAGVKKENLKITKKGRIFTITCIGTKSDDDKKDEKKVAILRKGLKVPSTDGDVTSYFSVPEQFDVDKAKFNYEDGLLTIVVPLKEEEKPSEIKF